MSFFVGKLCSCGFIVELCCLAEITLKTIHRWPYLAGPRSLLVPLLCPNVFIWLNVPLLISVIVFSHLDTIKDYVMLCYVMLCYVMFATDESLCLMGGKCSVGLRMKTEKGGLPHDGEYNILALKIEWERNLC